MILKKIKNKRLTGELKTLNFISRPTLNIFQS